MRRTGLPGDDLDGVHYVRTIADIDSVADSFRPGAKLVIVGAGYIGLETAAVAAAKGSRRHRARSVRPRARTGRL